MVRYFLMPFGSEIGSLTPSDGHPQQSPSLRFFSGMSLLCHFHKRFLVTATHIIASVVMAAFATGCFSEAFFRKGP